MYMYWLTVWGFFEVGLVLQRECIQLMPVYKLKEKLWFITQKHFFPGNLRRKQSILVQIDSD